MNFLIRKSLFISLSLFIYAQSVSASETESLIKWQGWSNEAFETAKKENKNVILYLEAVWCHWCHVIDQNTYGKKEIADLVNANYIPIRVDQDSRPDLSARYINWGWPATIFFNSKGEEILKKAGYIPPEEMKQILIDLKKDPTPRKDYSVKYSIPEKSALSPELKKALSIRYEKALDREKGGLDTATRNLDPDSIEYALYKAANGSEKDALWVNSTLLANLKLFDPEWGGVYQYSTHRGWDNAHYEKIMISQERNMRLYAQAYKVFNDSAYLHAAKEVARYIQNFLTSPEGAFYTSQDADLVKGTKGIEYFKLSDKERRAKGIPAVDKNIYSRENGMMIRSLAILYGISNEKSYLDSATKAAQWIIDHRTKGRSGGYFHGDNDAGGPYLSDSLSMGHAFLELYAVSGEKAWLYKAQNTANFIVSNFVIGELEGNRPGFYSSADNEGVFQEPRRDLNENIQAARFLNLLSHYIGDPKFKTAALHAMKFLAIPEVAKRTLTEPGILLADHELATDPLHLTVVGPKQDPKTEELHAFARSYPINYKRVDLWDKSEGPMINPDVQYPSLAKPAAFVCTENKCSLPLFTTKSLESTIKRLTKAE
ncbi:MAG: thioredoxin domain-containing protein [Deltaproteobacteria bacterium]|nr:thioredoxin domain-containing protein [Deltaproteobacteria bacterium]